MRVSARWEGRIGPRILSGVVTRHLISALALLAFVHASPAAVCLAMGLEEASPAPVASECAGESPSAALCAGDGSLAAVRGGEVRQIHDDAPATLPAVGPEPSPAWSAPGEVRVPPPPHPPEPPASAAPLHLVHSTFLI